MPTPIWQSWLCKPDVFPLEHICANQEVLNRDFSQDKPPTLTCQVTKESWLIFDKIAHGKGDLQWINTHSEKLGVHDDFYLEL